MKALIQVPAKDFKETDAIPASDTIYSGQLSAGVEQTLTTPSGADFVIINAENDIWVNYDRTAAVPSSTISQAGGELNPGPRAITSVAKLHLIAEIDTLVSLIFYSK